jgi:hypothetical protein
MPDALPLNHATAVPLPLPALALDGKPFTHGTVAVMLSASRDGAPIHSTLVWHARIVDGAWSAAPHVLPRDHVHLAPFVGARVWVVVVWAGRRVGEGRVKVAAAPAVASTIH